MVNDNGFVAPTLNEDDNHEEIALADDLAEVPRNNLEERKTTPATIGLLADTALEEKSINDAATTNDRHASRGKYSSSSNGQSSNNHGDDKRSSDGMSGKVLPGALVVHGKRISGTTTATVLRTSNEIMINKVAEQESSSPDEAPPLTVAAQVVNHDEDAKKVLERKVQEEVESRILRNQNNAVVAEPIGADDLPQSSDSTVRKVFGLTRKVWFYLIVGVALLLMVGVVAGVLVSKQDSGTESETTMIEQQEKLREGLKPWINRSDSEEDGLPLDDPASPQSVALEWLLNDTIALSENGVTSKVLARYALAVFYYSTDGPNWQADVNFLSESDECSWNNGLIRQDDDDQSDSVGFYCTPTVVLHLMQAGLNGTIPWELSLLSDLYFLRVDENSLFGSIPTELGQLAVLDTLNVAYNSLTGTLPTDTAFQGG